MGSVVTEAIVFVLMACMKGLAEAGEVTLAVAICVRIHAIRPDMPPHSLLRFTTFKIPYYITSDSLLAAPHFLNYSKRFAYPARFGGNSVVFAVSIWADVSRISIFPKDPSC